MQKQKGRMNAWPSFPFFSLSTLSRFWGNFLKWGNFLLMTHLWKWKRCGAWSMLLALTPNGGKNTGARAIFLHRNSHKTLRHTLRTIIAQSHTRLLFSFHKTHASRHEQKHKRVFCISSLSPNPNLSLCWLFVALSSPFQVRGRPWATAASEVDKV